MAMMAATLSRPTAVRTTFLMSCTTSPCIRTLEPLPDAWQKGDHTRIRANSDGCNMEGRLRTRVFAGSITGYFSCGRDNPAPACGMLKQFRCAYRKSPRPGMQSADLPRQRSEDRT